MNWDLRGLDLFYTGGEPDDYPDEPSPEEQAWEAGHKAAMNETDEWLLRRVGFVQGRVTAAGFELGLGVADAA